MSCPCMDTSGSGCSLAESHEGPHRFLSDEFLAFRTENQQLRALLNRIRGGLFSTDEAEHEIKALIDESGLLQSYAGGG